MRTKPRAAVELDNAATPTAVRQLLSELTSEELEFIAVEVIREHRRRLQCAQELFECIETHDTGRVAVERLAHARQAYRIAMLNLHAQHHLVSLVVAALGYVPEVDGHSLGDRPH